MGEPKGEALRELHEALGELVIASAAVEEVLRNGLIYLDEHGKHPRELPSAVKLSIARQSLGNLVDNFEERYDKRARTIKGLQRTGTLCDVVRGLNEERNDLLHAMWMWDDLGNVALRYRPRDEGGGLEINVQAVYPAKVRELASRLHDVEGKLVVTVADLIVHLEPPN